MRSALVRDQFIEMDDKFPLSPISRRFARMRYCYRALNVPMSAGYRGLEVAICKAVVKRFLLPGFMRVRPVDKIFLEAVESCLRTI